MEGRALTTFLYCRIGFCVNHPARECAGLPCQVEHADGAVERATFPRLVAAEVPLSPFVNLRALRYPAGDEGLRVEVRLDGDLFEMEDQRIAFLFQSGVHVRVGRVDVGDVGVQLETGLARIGIQRPKQGGDRRPPDQVPESDRDYYLERMYPSYGNLAPRLGIAYKLTSDASTILRTGFGITYFPSPYAAGNLNHLNVPFVIADARCSYSSSVILQ